MQPSRQDPPTVPATETVAAHVRQPQLERPGVRPAGVGQVFRDLGMPYVSNG